MNYATVANVFEWWAKSLEYSIAFWKNWEVISQYQKSILENYRNALGGGYMRGPQFAPTSLTQAINPWSFSLMQFTSEIKGDPETEYKILTEVAGYGSQLGTIMDFLQILEKACHLDPAKLKDPDEILAYYKFHDLVKKIDQIKQSTAA